jgi:hypothetical protein
VNEPPPDDGGHCWHSRGLGFDFGTGPPRHPEVCCHCGVSRTRTRRKARPAGHGPYAPEEDDGWTYSGPGTLTRCAARSHP